MFVAVQLSDAKNNAFTSNALFQYVQIPDEILGQTLRDGHRKARQIAFRLVHKRRESDLGELMQNTFPLEVHDCSQEVAKVLLELQ